MENFFESLEYASLNIHELWCIKDEKKYRHILSSYDSTVIHKKIRDILKSSKIFLSKVSAILNNNFFVIDQDRFEYEQAVYEIFKSIIQEIELNEHMDAFATNGFIDLFSFISKNIDKSIFKIKTLIYLLQITGKSKKFLIYLHYRHVKIVFTSLEIDIVENDYYYEIASNIYPEEIQNFFDHVKDSFIKHNISVIQNFYEFATIKSRRVIVNCPYTRIAKLILKRCVSIEKIPCKTIYFDLVDNDVHDERILILLNKEERIQRLLRLFKKFLQTDLNTSSAGDFIFELTQLITYENSKGEPSVLEQYYAEICEKVFDVYISTLIFERKELNKICANFAENLQYSIKKCHSSKINKQLILEIIINLTKIPKILIEKTALINQDMVQSFIKLMKTFCPIVTVTKIEKFHSEIIELILSLVNLLNASNDINLVEFIKDLIVNNLNAKRSNLLNQIQWVLILNGILKYLYNLNDTQSLNRIYEQITQKKHNIRAENIIVKGLADCLIEKIKMNYKVVSYIQDSLFEYILCKPIQMKMEQENFYEIIQLFYPLLSFGHLSMSIDRLKPIFNMSLHDDKRKLFDPKRVKFYQQPASLFLKFYTIMSVLLKCRVDARKVFHEELIELISVLEVEDFYLEIDMHTDEANYQENTDRLASFTIYYFILVSFSKSILDDVNYEFEIVNRLMKIWFKLYQKRISDHNIRQNFENCINSLTVNYPNILNFYSEKLWDFYLIKEQHQFAKNLAKIFHISSVFAKKYDMVFYKKLLNHDTVFLASTDLLLPQIGEYYPEFYLIKNDLNELRIITLIRLAISLKEMKFLKNLLKSFQIVIGLIENSKEKNWTQKKKANGYAEYLLQYCIELKGLINSSETVDDYEEIMIFMICFYSFLVNSLNYDKLTVVLKNLKSFVDDKLIDRDISSKDQIQLVNYDTYKSEFNRLIEKIEVKLNSDDVSNDSNDNNDYE